MKLLPLITAVTAMAVCGKQGRTFYDDVRLERARERIRGHDWAEETRRNLLRSCEWHLRFSLAECWDLVPPPEQLRAINVSHGIGCPDCGEAIFRKAGHYPWILDRDHPFKVGCPVCSKRFPENDFKPWNPRPRETQPERGKPIRDEGVGWEDAEGHRFWFVSYYLFWQRWRRDVIRGVHHLGQAYMLTDDPRYARRAAVMLANLALRYRDFRYEEQVYHEGIWGIRGRISDYIWSCGDNSSIALAYDAIYPILLGDADLDAFFSRRAIDDPRTLIETDMLQVMTDDIMRGYVAGNMGMHQRTLAELAIVLDNDSPDRGTTSEQMRTWLMAGPGRVEDLLWNGFWRDGLGGESSPSYASGWGVKFYNLAELLPRLGLDIWDNPKLRRMADIGPNLLVADAFTPCIGDCGGVRGARHVGLSREVHGPAFMRYGDPRYAAALVRINAQNRELWKTGFDEVQVQEAAPRGTLAGNTRVLGGYGLAVLESGEAGKRRGLTLYYGDATGGHGHYDRLTLGFFALGYPMFCEMGYPTPFRTPKRFGWTSNTASHFAVLVDGLRQRTREAGTLQALASSPGIQWVDASADRAYPDRALLYRRQTALVDLDDSRSYVLDVLRVTGGSQHDWCFHGPAFTEFSVKGADLGPIQRKGTLAGEEVPFGSLPPGASESNGFEFLFDVRRMRPPRQWSCTWRNPADGVCLTTHVPEDVVQQAIVACAEPEMQPGNPEAIHVVVGRNRYDAPPGVGEFISVSEAHRGDPRIRAVTRLTPSERSPGAVGLAIHKDTGTDFVHSSLDGQSAVQWQTEYGVFTATAEYALVTVDTDGPRRAAIINGAGLRFGDLALESTPPVVATVVAVDLFDNTVTIDRSLERPETYANTAVVFSNQLHRTAYMVEAVTIAEHGSVLHLGRTPLRVGMGEVAGIDPQTGSVRSDRPLSGYGRIENGRHQGRWLADEQGRCVGRIAHVNAQQFHLQVGKLDNDNVFRDHDGDGRILYWISEVGPGDQVRFSVTTVLERG